MNISTEYWAGLFDGEGSVSISNVLRPRATITQKRVEILELAKLNFGGEIYNKGKGCSFWVVTKGEDVEKFLKLIYPFVIIKKKEVEVVLNILPSIKKDNSGFNPLTEQEKNRRLLLRKELQNLRPSKLFADRPSLLNIKRQEIKEAYGNKCFECNKDLKEEQYNAIISNDEKLRCRGCNAKLFGPNKVAWIPRTLEQITEAIKTTNSLESAANKLGMSKATLYYKMKRLNVSKTSLTS